MVKLILSVLQLLLHPESDDWLPYLSTCGWTLERWAVANQSVEGLDQIGYGLRCGLQMASGSVDHMD